MAQQRVVGVIMNGVTGRMGMNQHLIRSILAIRAQGGLEVPGGDPIWPEPILVGRSERKLAALAAEHGVERWTTDLDAALADPSYEIYFDAQLTSARPPAVEQAIAAGKHVYCEKPVTPDVESALALARQARDAGVKVGVVQDKLFLPGLLKLRRLVESGFFGRIIAARGEFGYWVYPGPDPKPQRPSWNYRSEDGGGIISDMFPHWRYVLDNVFGPVRSVCAIGATHIPQRVDEDGETYDATAEDAAYAMFQFDGGLIVQMNSSWCVRVNRDELFELQVDGTRRQRGRRPARVQGPVRGRRRRSRSGTRTCPTPSSTARRGPTCRPPSRPRTASSCSGRPSCATSCSTSRSRGTSSRARAACSSTSSASSRGASAAGSTSRS